MSARQPLQITDVQLVEADAEHQARGLLGWLTFKVDGVLIFDGFTLRKTREGRLTLSYPAQDDATGRRRPVVRPLDDEARQQIEALIFAELRRLGRAS